MLFKKLLPKKKQLLCVQCKQVNPRVQLARKYFRHGAYLFFLDVAIAE
jgi:hypothetical protein